MQRNACKGDTAVCLRQHKRFFLAVPTVVHEVPTASGSFQRYKWTGCFSLTRSRKLTAHARAALRRRPSYIVAYGNKTSFSCSSFNSKKTGDEARPVFPWNAALNYSSGAGVCKSSECFTDDSFSFSSRTGGTRNRPKKRKRMHLGPASPKETKKHDTHSHFHCATSSESDGRRTNARFFTIFFFLSPLPDHT